MNLKVPGAILPLGCAIEKPYERNFQTSGYEVLTKPIRGDPEELTHVIEGLEPSTLYEFLVSPITADGEGKADRLEVYTKGAIGRKILFHL